MENRLCGGSGITCEIFSEDPRYPVLVISDGDWTTGYRLSLEDGSLERVCLCHARHSSECACGAWDYIDEG